ncbi:MAG: alpha/beta hydrolase [Erysipelotrichaceae bacterium]|nr:alpha/beta hydrolase [Erysipelotrichaceae bacterium]
MKRRILMMLAALIMVSVLTGCYPSRVAHEEYRYYDEYSRLLWQGRERNEEFEQQCENYLILVYDRDGLVQEIHDYWYVNDPDPRMHHHLHTLNSYEGDFLKGLKSYHYLYDGTLYQLTSSEFRPDGKISRYAEYSTEGRETLLGYEEFEFDEKTGEMSRSAYYEGDGTLSSDQQWLVNADGSRTWITTTYDQKGEILHRHTETWKGDGYPQSSEDYYGPDYTEEFEPMIQIERFEAYDFTMQYFRFGEGEKTMVILPGLSIGSVMPSAQAIADEYAVFQEDYTVYVFDRRSVVPEDYSVWQMAEDTASVMLQLDLHDVCLFGASQGGMIALVIALEHPELVSRLAIGSSAARVDDDQMAAINEWIALAEAEKGEELYVDFGRKLYAPEVFEQYKQVLADLGKPVSKPEFEKFVILARGTRGFDVLDRLPQIQCPFMAIGSADDAVLGSDALKQIVSVMEGKENFSWYEYDGHGHAAFDMAPDYRQRLFDFFSK